MMGLINRQAGSFIYPEKTMLSEYDKFTSVLFERWASVLPYYIKKEGLDEYTVEQYIRDICPKKRKMYTNAWARAQTGKLPTT
jgi:hypothetical protein